MRPAQVTGPDGRPVSLPDGKPLMTVPNHLGHDLEADPHEALRHSR